MHAFGDSFEAVLANVFWPWGALKVVDRVVERVPVDVVDVASARDCSVVALPHLSMQPVDASLAVGFSWREVHTQASVFGVRVSIEGDAIELHSLASATRLPPGFRL
jgi:hypothetical protein